MYYYYVDRLKPTCVWWMIQIPRQLGSGGGSLLAVWEHPYCQWRSVPIGSGEDPYWQWVHTLARSSEELTPVTSFIIRSFIKWIWRPSRNLGGDISWIWAACKTNYCCVRFLIEINLYWTYFVIKRLKMEFPHWTFSRGSRWSSRIEPSKSFHCVIQGFENCCSWWPLRQFYGLNWCINFVKRKCYRIH